MVLSIATIGTHAAIQTMLLCILATRVWGKEIFHNFPGNRKFDLPHSIEIILVIDLSFQCCKCPFCCLSLRVPGFQENHHLSSSIHLYGDVMHIFFCICLSSCHSPGPLCLSYPAEVFWVLMKPVFSPTRFVIDIEYYSALSLDLKKRNECFCMRLWLFIVVALLTQLWIFQMPCKQSRTKLNSSYI